MSFLIDRPACKTAGNAELSEGHVVTSETGINLPNVLFRPHICYGGLSYQDHNYGAPIPCPDASVTHRGDMFPARMSAGATTHLSAAGSGISVGSPVRVGANSPLAATSLTISSTPFDSGIPESYLNGIVDHTSAEQLPELAATKRATSTNSLRRRALSRNQHSISNDPVAEMVEEFVREQEKVSATIPTKRVKKKVEKISDDSETDEDEDDQDWVTRCVCGFEHDDGWMICCDGCGVWQHVDCMGMSKSTIPKGAYFCEQCQPRDVDCNRAISLQRKKLEKGLDSTSSDSEKEKPKRRHSSTSKKSPSKSVQLQQTEPSTRRAPKAEPSAASLNSHRNDIGTDATFSNDSKNTDRKPPSSDKKPLRKLLHSEYSEEILSLLLAHRLNGQRRLTSKWKPSPEDLSRRLYKVANLNKWTKRVDASRDVGADQAILEFKGRYMTPNEFDNAKGLTASEEPRFCVAYNKLGFELVVDAADFDCNGKFIRRSCVPNCEVRHHLDEDKLRLFICATSDIKPGVEITIPFDFTYQNCDYEVSCACGGRKTCPVANSNKRRLERRRSAANDSAKAEDDSAKVRETGRRKRAHSSAAAEPSEPQPSNSRLRDTSTEERSGSDDQSEVEDTSTSSHPVKHARRQTQQKLKSPQRRKERASSPNDSREDLKKPVSSREERKMEAIMKQFQMLEKQKLSTSLSSSSGLSSSSPSSGKQRRSSAANHITNTDSKNVVPPAPVPEGCASELRGPVQAKPHPEQAALEQKDASVPHEEDQPPLPIATTTHSPPPRRLVELEQRVNGETPQKSPSNQNEEAHVVTMDGAAPPPQLDRICPIKEGLQANEDDGPPTSELQKTDDSFAAVPVLERHNANAPSTDKDESSTCVHINKDSRDMDLSRSAAAVNLNTSTTTLLQDKCSPTKPTKQHTGTTSALLAPLSISVDETASSKLSISRNDAPPRFQKDLKLKSISTPNSPGIIQTPPCPLKTPISPEKHVMVPPPPQPPLVAVLMAPHLSVPPQIDPSTGSPAASPRKVINSPLISPRADSVTGCLTDQESSFADDASVDEALPTATKTAAASEDSEADRISVDFETCEKDSSNASNTGSVRETRASVQRTDPDNDNSCTELTDKEGEKRSRTGVLKTRGRRRGRGYRRMSNRLKRYRVPQRSLDSQSLDSSNGGSEVVGDSATSESPKTKKQLMTEWLAAECPKYFGNILPPEEEEVVISVQSSRHRSGQNAFKDLKRVPSYSVSSSSKNAEKTSSASAKKRWLKLAMAEDSFSSTENSSTATDPALSAPPTLTNESVGLASMHQASNADPGSTTAVNNDSHLTANRTLSHQDGSRTAPVAPPKKRRLVIEDINTEQPAVSQADPGMVKAQPETLSVSSETVLSTVGDVPIHINTLTQSLTDSNLQVNEVQNGDESALPSVPDQKETLPLVSADDVQATSSIQEAACIPASVWTANVPLATSAAALSSTSSDIVVSSTLPEEQPDVVEPTPVSDQTVAAPLETTVPASAPVSAAIAAVAAVASASLPPSRPLPSALVWGPPSSPATTKAPPPTCVVPPLIASTPVLSPPPVEKKKVSLSEYLSRSRGSVKVSSKQTDVRERVQWPGDKNATELQVVNPHVLPSLPNIVKTDSQKSPFSPDLRSNQNTEKVSLDPRRARKHDQLARDIRHTVDERRRSSHHQRSPRPKSSRASDAHLQQSKHRRDHTQDRIPSRKPHGGHSAPKRRSPDNSSRRDLKRSKSAVAAESSGQLLDKAAAERKMKALLGQMKEQLRHATEKLKEQKQAMPPSGDQARDKNKPVYRQTSAPAVSNVTQCHQSSIQNPSSVDGPTVVYGAVPSMAHSTNRNQPYYHGQEQQGLQPPQQTVQYHTPSPHALYPLPAASYNALPAPPPSVAFSTNPPAPPLHYGMPMQPVQQTYPNSTIAGSNGVFNQKQSGDSRVKKPFKFGQPVN